MTIQFNQAQDALSATNRRTIIASPSQRLVIAVALIIYLNGCGLKTIPSKMTQGHIGSMQTVVITRPRQPVELLDTGYLSNDFHPTVLSAVYESDGIPEQPQWSNLWEKLPQSYQLSWRPNPLINSIISRHTRHPHSILRITRQAKPYLYHVVSEVEKRNMPMEIALLPIVESRYDPFAYSPHKAAGIWQFIPGTGRRFGLEQNQWYDGRRDIVASTEAALDYLTYLNKLFNGDWLLSLAAYNAGEGTVLRAMRRNRKRGKATDYWSLSLPKETTYYVPKLLAWAEMIKNPIQYQIDLTPISNEPFFTTVHLGSRMDLAAVAAMANMSVDLLYQLNPGYNRRVKQQKPLHRLAVPTTQASMLIEALANHRR